MEDGGSKLEESRAREGFVSFDQGSVIYVILDSNQPSILNPQSSILNPQSSILNPQSSMLDLRSSILDPRSSILNPQWSILDPQCSILDPQSSIIDHQSSTIRIAGPPSDRLSLRGGLARNRLPEPPPSGLPRWP
jgi:hypothetical protein